MAFSPVVVSLLRRFTQSNDRVVIVPESYFDTTIELEEEEPTLQQRIHKTLSDPIYSKKALLYQFFQFSVIILSTVVFIVSTEPQYWEDSPTILRQLEIFSISIFTFDYLARFITASKKRTWIVEGMNIVDVLAIAPFYLELLLSSTNIGGLSILRVLRLLQVLRILKVGKHSNEVPIITRTLRMSVRGLLMLVFGLLIGVVVSASALFYMELSTQTFDSNQEVWYREDGSESPFQSIPETMWCSIVTMTSVGYGDTFPVSDAGKFVAAMTMILGALVIGFPLAILSNNFSESEKTFTSQQISEKRKQMAKKLKSQQKVPVRVFTSTIKSDISSITYSLSESQKVVDSLRGQVRDIQALYQALYPSQAIFFENENENILTSQ